MDTTFGAYVAIKRIYPESKFRIGLDEDDGWFLTYGPRRPVSSRITIKSGMTQKEANIEMDKWKVKL